MVERSHHHPPAAAADPVARSLRPLADRLADIRALTMAKGDGTLTEDEFLAERRRIFNS